MTANNFTAIAITHHPSFTQSIQAAAAAAAIRSSISIRLILRFPTPSYSCQPFLPPALTATATYLTFVGISISTNATMGAPQFK
jgi:hypothetical protein